jgi:ribosomal 50S subunit-recycling heat shock protein
MRLDKFLKWSRLIKRRTVANELSGGGGVLVNHKVAKPSTLLKLGDILEIDLGRRVITVRVEVLPARPPSVQTAETLYSLLSETVSIQEKESPL